MPTLADIYSAADSFKRRLYDTASNPLTSAQQMLGYAADRARNLRQQIGQSAQESMQTGEFVTPQDRVMAQQLAEAYNPVGMTVKYGYRGQHTAPGPDFGAPLHDLTGGGQMYPSDVYAASASRIYGGGMPYDRKAFDIAQSYKDKPNASVTIYRAVPKELSNSEKLATLEKQMAAYMKRGTLPKDAENYSSGSKWYDWAYEERNKLRDLPDEPMTQIGINPGDWVTLTREYAKDHGESALKGQYKILSKKVKAKDLWTNADSIHEFGYNPSND